MTIWLEPNDAVRRLARAAFPDYTGRTFRAVITADPVSLESHWSEGSRDYYVLVRSDGATVQAPQSGTMFDGPLSRAPAFAPRPDVVVVERSIFRGEEVGLTFYIHPSLAPRMLPAPAGSDDLSDAERAVLIAASDITARFRREECAKQGIGPDAYDAALEGLKGRGYLNRAGAITVSGRNALTRARRKGRAAP